MMESPADFMRPVNIGNPGKFSIPKLAELIIQMTNSKRKLIFKRFPQYDPKQRQPDITLAKSELSWEVALALETGREKTITYFKTVI